MRARVAVRVMLCALFAMPLAGCAATTDSADESESDEATNAALNGAPIYAENFDDGVANGFIVRKGQWQVQSGRYMGGGASGAVSTISGLGALSVYDVDADAQFGGAPETIDWLKALIITDAFVVLDFQSGTNFKWVGVVRKGSTNVYSCTIGRYDGAFHAVASVDTCITRTSTSSKWTHLQASVDGANVTLTVDGVPRVSHTFAAALTGAPGAGAKPYGWGKLDNVIVSAPAAAPP